MKPKSTSELDGAVWRTWNMKSHTYDHEMSAIELREEMLKLGFIKETVSEEDVEASLHRVFDL